MNRILIEKACGENVFESVQKEWKQLFAAGHCSPFLSWEWLSTWHRWLGVGRAPLILKAYLNDQLIGLMPLCHEEKKVLGMRFKRLALLGEQIGGADYLDVIARPENKAEVIGAFFEYLKKENSFDLIHLENLASDSETIEILQTRFKQSDEFRLAIQTTEVCPKINLTVGWGGVLKQSKRATNFKRRLRQLEKMRGFEFRSAASPAEVEAAFERFYQLHEKRWANAGGSELCGHPRLVSFQRDLVLKLARAGLVRFEELWIEGACRASAYGLDDGKTFYYYNSGYDLEWANYSVGLVLIGHSIRSAIERGNTVYDFLRGNETYKFDWASEQTDLVAVRLQRNSLSALAHEMVNRTWTNLRGFSKTILPAPIVEKLKNHRRQWKRNYQMPELKAEATQEVL